MGAAKRTRIKEWVKAHWPKIRKIGIGCFIVLVLVLLGLAVTKIDWGKVLGAIQDMPASVIAMASLVTACSYLTYGCFELLGKRYTGHPLPWWRTLMIGLISYAFTMTMGAPVGGLGLRMRLYARQDIEQSTVMRVVAVSLTTNWIGYSLLAGCLFTAGVIELPAQWSMGGNLLRVFGIALIMTGIGYVLACAFSKKRAWKVYGHDIELPSVGMALAQLSLAILNWALIGAVIYILFQGKVAYLDVLAILLVSAVAGALMHIPGGLGVIESVFVALLYGALPRSETVATLLVYRAIYYLAPLLIAGLGYLVTETKLNVSNRLKT